MFQTLRRREGFTLLEVLLVIALIAILAAIVIVAINPGKQLDDANNADRQADVEAIINAVYQYAIDNEGALPGTIPTTDTEICQSGASNCTGLVDLSALTANGTYIVAMPEDPSGGSTNGTGYEISQDANGRLTVSAPNAAQGETIEITR